jgi:carbon monoxide dehydrogenase subunit G
MKLSTKVDIEAPIDDVFGALTDFEGFERAALRRGAEVVRMGQPRPNGVDQVWRVGFDYRGKRRLLTARLVALDRPNALRFQGTAKSLDGEMLVDLVALSRRQTRVTVAMEIKPKTLSARIFVQSLVFARSRINDRFAKRIRSFAQMIEDRLRKPSLG